MVKVQKKFRKKRFKKVHTNWLQMILLLPIYLYMKHREAAHMLMCIEQRRLQNLDTKQDTSEDEVDEDFNLKLCDDDDDDDDDVPFSVLLDRAQLVLDHAQQLHNVEEHEEAEEKTKTNFNKFVKKNEFIVCQLFKKSNLFILFTSIYSYIYIFKYIPGHFFKIVHYKC